MGHDPDLSETQGRSDRLSRVFDLYRQQHRQRTPALAETRLAPDIERLILARAAASFSRREALL